MTAVPDLIFPTRLVGEQYRFYYYQRRSRQRLPKKWPGDAADQRKSESKYEIRKQQSILTFQRRLKTE